MILDLSSNGTLADEAQLLLAISTVIGLFYGGARISKRVKKIDHAVNNVDAPIEDPALATLGQRIVRLESTHYEHNQMLRTVADALHTHMAKADFRHRSIEKKLNMALEMMDRVPETGS